MKLNWRPDADQDQREDVSTTTSIARKVVINALPRLVAACSWEAKVLCGQESIIAIVSSAEIWIQNDWQTILEKELLLANSSSTECNNNNGNTNNKNSSERKSNEQKGLVLSRLLLESHHITDRNKVKLVKDLTSQFNLGCSLKIGRPGLVLIEGLDENCKTCASELVKNRTKQRAQNMTKKTGKDTATFDIRGSVKSTAVCCGSELEDSRILSLQFEELDGSHMAEFERKCEALGLSEWMPTLT